MKKVSQKVFDGVRQLYRMVELDFETNGMEDRVKMYGAEVGKDVLIASLYNDDISTSMSVIPNHEIVECDGKYMIAPRDVTVKIPEPVMEEKLTKDLSTDELEKEIDNFPRNTKSIEDARLAAIEASDNDNTIQLRGLPEDGDGEDVPSDVASYIDSLVAGKTDTPPPVKPKKPQQKLALKPSAVNPITNPDPKPDIQKGKQKNTTPPATNGSSAFGGW